MRETVLGKEHPSTLTSMNNMATVLSDQGKYKEAEGGESITRLIKPGITVISVKRPSEHKVLIVLLNASISELNFLILELFVLLNICESTLFLFRGT
jgi:hypothetical protein